MAKQKYDGVIDTVHYGSDGQIKWVRAYLRRGATYTDNVLLERQDLIERIRAGKKIYAGRRVPLMASTFEVGEPVRLIERNGHPILVIGDKDVQQDFLENVPLF